METGISNKPMINPNGQHMVRVRSGSNHENAAA